MLNYYEPQAAFLGALCNDPAMLPQALAIVSPCDFEDSQLADCYAQIIARYQERGTISKADFPNLSCWQLLQSLTNNAVTVSGLLDYARTIHESAIQRRAGEIGMKLASSNASREEMLALQAELADVLNDTQAERRVHDLASVAGVFLLAQDSPQDDKRFSTRLPALDECLTLKGGQMLVIGGRPSAGKTALGVQLAIAFALKKRKTVFFSYETDAVTLFERMISHWAQLDYGDIVQHRLPKQNKKLHQDAAELTELAPYLKLVNAGGKPVAWLASVAAAEQAECIIVDYLQLIPAKGASRYEEVTRVSMDLHTLAQTTGRLVVALAQLNRNASTSTPSMSDIKESGQIEQDADAVVLLAAPPPGDDKRNFYFTVAKNKRGNCGRLPIAFDGQHQTFFEYTA